VNDLIKATSNYSREVGCNPGIFSLVSFLLFFVHLSSVEVFLVDLGRTAVAGVAQICAGFPPVMMKIPQQALQCVLAGVEQVRVAPVAGSISVQSHRRSLSLLHTYLHVLVKFKFQHLLFGYSRVWVVSGFFTTDFFPPFSPALCG